MQLIVEEENGHTIDVCLCVCVSDNKPCIILVVVSLKQGRIHSQIPTSARFPDHCTSGCCQQIFEINNTKNNFLIISIDFFFAAANGTH